MSQKDETDYDAIDMIPLVLSVREKSAMNSFSSLVHTPFSFTHEEDGRLMCTFKAENSIELMMRLFQCGRSVTIVQPESYRRKYLTYMRDILDSYADEV